MKKEDVSGLIVYVIMLALALVFGLTILQDHQLDSGLSGVSYFLYVFAGIASGLIFNAILFEVGHVVGAKIGGYNIVSVCVLGFTFYKSEGKIKFRFKNFDGLTGETKIVPNKDRKKECNPTAYLWFGTLFYLVELLAVVIVFALFGKSEVVIVGNVAYFLLIMAALGILILLYNIVPLKLDATTDGYRLKLVSNPRNREAFNELLRVQYEIENGNADVEIKTFDTITNFTADLNVNKVYVLLGKKEFAEAEKLLDVIIENKENISESVHLKARCQKIYINIMTKSYDEAKEYYNKEVSMEERRLISKSISMEAIRAYILIEGLFDKSRSECLIALNNVYKAFKHTPKQRQEVEIGLYNEALQKVIDAHPDWELEGYILTSATKKDSNKE